MNLKELLLQAREQRLDDVIEPYLWSDGTLKAHFNDAVRQAAIRKRLLLDSDTPSICTVALAAGIPRVRLKPEVLAVRSARIDGVCGPLTLTTGKVMDKDCPDWTERSGTPERLVLDLHSGTLDVYPRPDKAYTMRMRVWRIPLDTEVMEGAEDEPVIDLAFHPDLIDWVEHLAYSLADADLRDPQRASMAEERFTQKFGRLPSAHEIKSWAIAPPRGQRAEFL